MSDSIATLPGSTETGPASSGLTAVAMSGGLDSSVVAWLLAQESRPVVGLSMLLWDRSEEASNGRCCGALDLGDAKRVAQQAGIPHYTLRMDQEFREKVVDPFVGDYLAGRTPSPCVACNTWIKFDLLWQKARAFGAESLATGHYARIVAGPEGPELHTATNPEKDQSYYLFELSAEQLAASQFPLGEKTKTEVRELARAAGLAVAEKGESMEVCFVAGGVREFVESEAAAAPERFKILSNRDAETAGFGTPAILVDREGNELGRGEPYYRYTVGQRRGLGLASANRLYVLAIEPETNRVVVGSDDELFARGLTAERLHWIGPPPESADQGVEATVKIRSRHPGVAARIRSLPDGRAEVEFETPQRGVAPGQAAVFYRGSRVLGGGWITGELR